MHWLINALEIAFGFLLMFFGFALLGLIVVSLLMYRCSNRLVTKLPVGEWVTFDRIVQETGSANIVVGSILGLLIFGIMSARELEVDEETAEDILKNGFPITYASKMKVFGPGDDEPKTFVFTHPQVYEYMLHGRPRKKYPKKPSVQEAVDDSLLPAPI